MLFRSQQTGAESLLAQLRGKMADYKIPRHIELVDDFPRTSTGKIQRFVLQQRATEKVSKPV